MAACTMDPWGVNARGAYHTHAREGATACWEAGNGLWRVRELAGSQGQWRLERRSDTTTDDWLLVDVGSNSDDLLARGARKDRAEGVPDRLGRRACWFGR